MQRWGSGETVADFLAGTNGFESEGVHFATANPHAGAAGIRHNQSDTNKVVDL